MRLKGLDSILYCVSDIDEAKATWLALGAVERFTDSDGDVHFDLGGTCIVLSKSVLGNGDVYYLVDDVRSFVDLPNMLNMNLPVRINFGPEEVLCGWVAGVKIGMFNLYIIDQTKKENNAH